MGRISLKAVLVGGVVDITASVLAGVLLALFIVLAAGATHVPRSSFHQHGILTGIAFAGGLLISALGGFVAA